MNKYINHKGYNTETAQALASWNNGIYPNDFNWCKETLYIKKTGEYFLHGDGGAYSKYGCREEIIPLSASAAINWAENKLDGGEVEKIFGVLSDEEEANNTAENSVSYQLRLPETMFAKLKAKKAETGITILKLIEKALREAGY